MYDPDQITYFAETDARNRNVPFGIKARDRTRHVYVIGKTGMGKSTILENMAVQDIQNGNGFAFIDPHGKTADLFLEYIPEERKKDVLYFAPFDMDYPISFNIMEDVGYDKRHLVVSGLMASFKKIWQDAWSARMEYILSNTLLALLEYPDSTLLSVNKMLSDKSFREKVVANIKDTSVKSFWVDEFAKYTDRFAAEATPAIQNKIGQFTSNPLIRNIVGQPKSSFNIREMMDNQKILIINLSKGRIGEANANLLGSLLITKIYLSAMSRADVPERVLENELPNFYLYVDEFQSFANESFADILSEARKYKLNLTIAHQYIEQMSDEVRAAVFGNVGTMITFRVGSYDAEVLEKEFAPEFTAQDIVNLGRFQIYLRLMIDSVGSKPFSGRTLPPLEKPERSMALEIIEYSRQTYGRPRDIVEDEVRALVEMGRDESGSGKTGGKDGGSNGGGGKSNNKSGGREGGGNNNGGNGGGDRGSANANNNGERSSDRNNKNNDKKGDSSKSEDKKPVIDEKTKNELNALLSKFKEKETEEPAEIPSDIIIPEEKMDDVLIVEKKPDDLIVLEKEEEQEEKQKPEEVITKEIPISIPVAEEVEVVKKVELEKEVVVKDQKVANLQEKINKIMDRDLKNDLQPMMVSPASRNDPKKVSSENRNQLADALKAALGESFIKKEQPLVKMDLSNGIRPERNNRPDQKRSEQTKVRDGQRLEAKTQQQPKLQKQSQSQPPTPSIAMSKMGSMTDAIGAVLKSTNSPKPNSEVNPEPISGVNPISNHGLDFTPKTEVSSDFENQTEVQAQSQIAQFLNNNKPVKEVPEEELRGILKD